MKPKIQKILLYAGCVLFFAALACTFAPEPVFKGKFIQSKDISGYTAASHEAKQWDQDHPDDKTAWTGSMFGGMPTILLTGNDAGDGLKPVFDALKLTRYRPVSYLLLSLLGAFLLMLSLGIRPLLAAGGAVAITFCSYNLQIIACGHNTKMLALAYFPYVLAAAIFTYRKALAMSGTDWRSWLPATFLGAVLFGFATAFQVKADHIQISWYLALVLALYAATLLIGILTGREFRRRRIGRFFCASLLLLILGGAGIATSASKLVPLYEYTSYSMRGGSSLSDTEQKGLGIDKVTFWSYGWQELPNLMIPNLNGGSTDNPITNEMQTVKTIQRIGMENLTEKDRQLTLYWGPQPQTYGPMYLGAITVFLFLLGLLFYRGREKWWLLAATLIAVGLALGSHLLPFTKFFYRFVPFYSKFRAVSMALVILQFTLPMLGFMVLERLFREGCDRKVFLRKGGIALALTGGVCLLLALFPSLAGSFVRPEDAGKTKILTDALIADRQALLRHDAWVCCGLIVTTFLLLWWALGKKKSPLKKPAPRFGRIEFASLLICVMVVANLFSVGRRYLNAGHFTTLKKYEKQFILSRADQMILKDPDPNFRVLDLSTSTFNDAMTSYWHKSIGGYSAAKLQRYHDLMERYLYKESRTLLAGLNGQGSDENLISRIPLLNLMNAKYFIVDRNQLPLYNPGALGSVWFIDSVRVARTPEEELALLAETPLKSEGILGPDFNGITLPVQPEGTPDTDRIKLVSYAPNELHYRYSSASGRAAVFSEVFHPGWKATLEDGSSVDLFRIDWTLRGALLPAGRHDIVMRYDPSSYTLGTRISRISSIFMYLMLLLCGAGLIKQKWDERKRLRS